MKKIMVYAYTEFNLGDDLFIKTLCERYPNTKFVLYAPKEYKKCFYNIKNIDLFPSNSIVIRGINYCFRKIKINNFVRKLVANTCDAGVLIGGSLFIESENWEDGIAKTREMRIKNKPFFLLGANFGPFHTNEYYEQYKKIFKEYTDICFREKYSYELFKDLSNVRMADDIIFQLKKPTIKEQENYIVISVIKPSLRKNLIQYYDEIYYQKIKDIVVYFIENGYGVTLMSFCENEGDEEAIEKIENLIPKSYLTKIRKHFYKTNIDETLSVITKSCFVVATRFHSMILGWLFNKPVFPIIYSEKMSNVMMDVGFEGFYTDFKNLNFLDPEQVYKSVKTNLIDVSKQIKQAEKHFEKLDQYLIEDIYKGS